MYSPNTIMADHTSGMTPNTVKLLNTMAFNTQNLNITFLTRTEACNLKWCFESSIYKIIIYDSLIVV